MKKFFESLKGLCFCLFVFNLSYLLSINFDVVLGKNRHLRLCSLITSTEQDLIVDVTLLH